MASQNLPTNVETIIKHVEDHYIPLHPEQMTTMLLKWQKWYSPLREMCVDLRQGKKISLNLVKKHKVEMVEYCHFFVNPDNDIEELDMDKMMLTIVSHAYTHGNELHTVGEIATPEMARFYFTNYNVIRAQIAAQKI